MTQQSTIPDTATERPATEQTPQPAAAAQDKPQRRSVLQLLLGSAFLVRDKVRDQLTPDAEPSAAETAPPADDDSPSAATYIAIGAARTVADQANRVVRGALDTTSNVAAATNRVTTPVWNSPVASPVREPVRRLRERGEEQLQEWHERGRAETLASRALAEESITDFVAESVSDLSSNIELQHMIQEVVMSPEVQSMIERIIAGQSSSIIGSIVDEIRERFVTLDILLERPLRRVFGRAPREQLPPPPPREVFIAHRQTLFKNRPMHHTLGGYSAGFATRLAAYLIDMVLILMIYTVSMSFITGTLSLFGVESLVRGWFRESALWQAAGVVILGALSLTIIMGYGALSWYLAGETVGDTIMGIRIIREDGQRVRFTQAVVRMIGCVIAAAPLFLGFLWVLGDDERRGWHDKFAGTYALYDWPAQTDEEFLIGQLIGVD